MSVYPKNSFISNTVRVNHVILTNYKGQTLDITNLILGIDIYENIYANALTGTIDVIDANDLIEFFPIIGEETIHIDIILPGFSDDSNFILDGYRIYKITDREVNNDKAQVYKLWFTSPEAIVNLEKKVSKAWYEKNTKDMVKEVFALLGSKKAFEIEDTVGVHNYISTNLAPFQVLNYLASHRSIGSHKLSDFMFFESFDLTKKTTKFNFKSLGYLSQLQSSIATFTYRPVVVDNPQGYAGNIQPYNVENITFKKGFNVIESKLKGLYNQTFVYYDMLRKKYVVQKSTYDDVFNESKDMRIEGASSSKPFSHNTGAYGENVTVVHTTSFPSRVSNSKDMSNVNNRGMEIKAGRGTNTYIAKTGLSSDKTSTLLEETLYRRKVLLSEFENNTIQLNDISGNYSYTVGAVIEFEKPHLRLDKNNAIEASSDNYDIFISGRYLITKSRHHIRRGERLNWLYKNYLEVSKNTIKNNLSKA